MLRQFSVCRHAVATTPVGPLDRDRFVRGCQPPRFSQRRRPSPIHWRVGSHIKPFEACSAFTRVTACRLAEPPERYLCLEGSDGFVTSTAAPIASGWSDRVAGWDLHPLGNTAFPRRTMNSVLRLLFHDDFIVACPAACRLHARQGSPSDHRMNQSSTLPKTLIIASGCPGDPVVLKLWSPPSMRPP